MVSMKPQLVDTNVKIIFYIKTSEFHWRTKLYQLVSGQKIIHSIVWFTQGKKDYVYVINPRRGMYLVDKSKYDRILKSQNITVEEEVIDLGLAPVSLYQLSCYLDRPEFKLASVWENIIWWLFGRFVSKTYVPMTCSLATSYLLRICGFKVGLHIAPHKLYKEIQDGVDNHFWKSKGWQDYTS
jgi:hypothetical protein